MSVSAGLTAVQKGSTAARMAPSLVGTPVTEQSFGHAPRDLAPATALRTAADPRACLLLFRRQGGTHSCYWAKVKL